MKIIKKLYLSFALSLVTVLLICLPKTNAKFLYENYGIAWDNHFTSFSQLKEVFYIEDSSGEDVNELWGGIKDGSVNGYSISNAPLKDGAETDWYSFGELDSNTRISENDIRTVYEDYLIENLKNIEINTVNQTKERMVVCFKIYYYSTKLSDVDTHISFGVYNTILHKNDTNKKSYSIIGEFVANITSGNYSSGEYSNVIEVPSDRLSGADGGEFYGNNSWVLFGRKWYYPHRAVINPYQILYDSGKDIPTGHYQEGGSVASYKYPAHDNQSNVDAPAVLDTSLLEEFILDPSESGSFNLSMYFGNYGDTSGQSDSASFVTSLALIAIPESEIIADIVANGGTAPAGT